MFQTLPLNAIAMVIEDDRKLSDIFCQALKGAGFTPQPAFTGEDALRLLPVLQPVLITLDLQLPDMYGEDILKQIRSTPALVKTWVIVATSEPNISDELQVSADLVLIKPVSFTQMRDLAFRFRRTAT